MPQPNRRAYSRIRKTLPVLILDPTDALGHPYRGWIVDYSPGGICLCYNACQAEAGDVLLVQPASAKTGLPWAKVQVKHQRRKRSRVELGCEFVRRKR